MVVEVGIAQRGRDQVLGRVEVLSLEDFGDAAIEALDHAVSFRMTRPNCSV